MRIILTPGKKYCFVVSYKNHFFITQIYKRHRWHFFKRLYGKASHDSDILYGVSLWMSQDLSFDFSLMLCLCQREGFLYEDCSIVLKFKPKIILQ